MSSIVRVNTIRWVQYIRYMYCAKNTETDEEVDKMGPNRSSEMFDLLLERNEQFFIGKNVCVDTTDASVHFHYYSLSDSIHSVMEATFHRIYMSYDFTVYNG